MKYKNSFFQLNIREDGVYLVVYPPVSDGKRLEVKEVVSFLDSKNCVNYEPKTLKQFLDDVDKEIVEMKVSNEKIPPFNESAVVSVSLDKMTAYIRFYPPSNGGKVMSKREILGELEHERVCHGISSKVLDVFMVARQYCLDIPIAKGTKPVLAKDTSIEYFFNTRPLAKPAMLEDGSVDFHNLSLFTKITKGALLARLTPHEEGVPGKNVFGIAVPTNRPKIKKLKFGKNIRINDEKTEIYSEVDGDINLTDDTVFVSNTYEVAADVDTSTGDIDYDGNVLIHGNIRTGFSVKAKGDIQVNGVVESANLVAGGNIVIKRGVQGMGKGKMEAGGDICAQFFESTNVKAGGNIIAGSILHSNISADGKVIVSGKKGFIVGGEVNCATSVEVNTIGNKMETQTHIKVAVNPELMDEIKAIVSKINDLSPIIEEYYSYINVYKQKLAKGGTLSPENLKLVKEYKDKLIPLEKDRLEYSEKLKDLKLKLDSGKKGAIKVSGYAYRGVTIFISSYNYGVKDKDSHCIYRVIDGEIVASAK